MKRLFKIGMLFVAVSAFVACTDGFDEMNKDPNKITVADPDFTFISSPVQTMMTFGSRNNYWIFGNYSGQISVAGGAEPTYGYGGKSDQLWSDIYFKMLLPLVEIEKNYVDHPGYVNRVAIARIWKSYIFSQAVALWGPIPYTRACLGDINTPYDSEEFIYKDLMESLKANAAILTDDGDKYPQDAEPVFNSNLAKWRIFAHSLRLKIAARLIDFEDAEVRAIAHEVIREELDGKNIIASNDENCRMQFVEDVAFRNPYFVDTTEEESFRGGVGTYPVIHEQFMMYLLAYDDPRIGVYCKKSEDSDYPYIGRPSTMRFPPDVQVNENPYENREKSDFSQVGNVFGARLAYHTLISYPEICCIRAEAAFRGIWTGDKSAEDYYYASIDAFAKRYSSEPSGATTITDAKLKAYKNQDGIKWSTPVDTLGIVDDYGDPIIYKYYDFLARANTSANEPLFLSNCYLGGEEDNYKRIIIQHWMALFFQGIDSWTLIRRTQQINFPPVWYPGNDYQLATKNYWAYLPHRLLYPIVEMTSLNPQETKKAVQMIGGYNSLHARLKFAKPVVAFDDFVDEFPGILGRE